MHSRGTHSGREGEEGGRRNGGREWGGWEGGEREVEGELHTKRIETGEGVKKRGEGELKYISRSLIFFLLTPHP